MYVSKTTQERMTTNKKKASNYYSGANVKNKNREKQALKSELPSLGPESRKKRK